MAGGRLEKGGKASGSDPHFILCRFDFFLSGSAFPFFLFCCRKTPLNNSIKPPGVRVPGAAVVFKMSSRT